jgi:hypothetical protein
MMALLNTDLVELECLLHIADSFRLIWTKICGVELKSRLNKRTALDRSDRPENKLHSPAVTVVPVALGKALYYVAAAVFWEQICDLKERCNLLLCLKAMPVPHGRPN